MPRNSFISLNVQGWRDLAKALEDLGNAPAIKATAKRAMLDAGELIARDARARVPRGATGNLRESIDVRPTLSPRQKAGHRAIGRSGTEVFVGPTWPQGAHGVLVEFGTTNRHTKKGANRGSTAARPFMRPAWEAQKRAVLTEFGVRLGLEIERTAKRIAKKQAKLIRGRK